MAKANEAKLNHIKPIKINKVRQDNLTARIYQHKSFYLMMLPAFIWVLIFKYIPMYGISMAFVNYNYSKGILASDWNNFMYFKQLFSSDMFVNALKNTVIISSYKIIFGFFAPIVLSILINEVTKKWYQRTLQTILYLPHFVSWVVFASLVTIILSPETGMVNKAIELLGGTPVYFLSEGKYFRGLLVITEILKEAGWGTIIYIAAITGIDTTFYEAATIDGANKFKQMIHITLPSITGTIVVMLILRLGQVLSAGMEQVINLYNPAVLNVGDILDTYVYRIGLEQFEMGLSTAAGLFQSIVGLVLVLFTNKIAKALSGKGIV